MYEKQTKINWNELILTKLHFKENSTMEFQILYYAKGINSF